MTEQERTCRVIDCIGLYCPEPLFRTRQVMESVPPGEIVEVLADDPAVEEDLTRFAKRAGHEVVKVDRKEESIRVRIRKGGRDG